MAGKTLYGLCALALLAGCDARQHGNEANTVMPSAETHNAAAAASEPLAKDQALALMKERHEHMEALGDATKAINRQLKSSAPDLAVIRQSAAKIESLAPDLHSWFPEGTGPDVGKTRAKAELWQKPEDFAAKAQDFRSASAAFDAAAKSGDLSEINASFAAMGKSCKACHDLYRAPEKD